MAEMGCVGVEHLGGAIELGGGLRDGLGVRAGNEHVHVLAQRLGGTHGLGDPGAQRLVVVVGQEQRRHESAPVSLSLAISSAAFATFTPALRPGGSTVFRTLRRGAGSTPKSAGFLTSSGFFLAFMMLGSEG